MSSAPDYYTQVRLVGLGDADGQVHVAWVPQRYAAVGKRLVIDDLPGRWRVEERYQTWPAARVLAKSRDHAKQREASDV